MKNRRSAKVDRNQNSIVKALREIPGVTVETEKDDILCGYLGRTFWFELKSPDAVSKKTGYILESAKKPSQIKLEREWAGHYRIVSSIDEILSDIGIK